MSIPALTDRYSNNTPVFPGGLFPKTDQNGRVSKSPVSKKMASANPPDPASMAKTILKAVDPFAAYFKLAEDLDRRKVGSELLHMYRTSPNDPRLVAFVRGLINHKQSNNEEKCAAIEALAEKIDPKAPPAWFKTELETLLKTKPGEFRFVSTADPFSYAAKAIKQMPGGEAFLSGLLEPSAKFPAENITSILSEGLLPPNAQTTRNLQRILLSPATSPQLQGAIARTLIDNEPTINAPYNKNLETLLAASFVMMYTSSDSRGKAANPFMQQRQSPGQTQKMADALKTLAKEKGLASKDAAMFQKWGDLIGKAAELGITQVHCYGFETLSAIVKNRLENKPDNRPVAVIMMATNDHNGSQVYTEARIKELIKNGYRVMLYEPKNTETLSESIAEVGKKQPIDVLMVEGHGSVDGIELSSQRNYGSLTGSTGRISASELSGLFDAKYLNKDFVIALISCSGGEGGNGNPQNLGNSLRSELSRQGVDKSNGKILSAEALLNAGAQLVFKNGRLVDVKDDVPIYQSNQADGSRQVG